MCALYYHNQPLLPPRESEAGRWRSSSTAYICFHVAEPEEIIPQGVMGDYLGDLASSEPVGALFLRSKHRPEM